MSWGHLQMAPVKRAAETVPLDMNVSSEFAEAEWYRVADETTYAPKITAYRERFEGLRLQEQTGKAAPVASYVPEDGAVEAVEADPELRFPGKAAPPARVAAPRITVLPKPTNPHAMPTYQHTQPNQAAIGARFKTAREKAGWPQGSVEKAAQIKKGTLWNIERGTMRKGLEEAARLLKINPRWLESGEGEIFLATPPAAPKKIRGVPVSAPGIQVAPAKVTPDTGAAKPIAPPKPAPERAEPAEDALQGLRPRHVVDSDRIAEIAQAIHRFVANGRACPLEWVAELVELTERATAGA